MSMSTSMSTPLALLTTSWYLWELSLHQDTYQKHAISMTWFFHKHRNFCADPHFWSDLTHRYWFNSAFPIRFDSPFLIQFRFSDSICLRYPNSTWLPFHTFYFWFESQHPNPSRVSPQGVPHRLECLEKIKSGIVEYYEIMKTKIAFGKDTLSF